jgi:cell fate regulator YaaT (PSP1 superfamily)
MSKRAVTVRYGATHEVGHFIGPVDSMRPWDDCVVKTSRGTELGRVLRVSEIEDNEVSGTLLRRATLDDIQKSRELETVNEQQELKFCTEEIQKLNVPMKLVAVEHLLGDEKIIFYFTAEGRVDFRELVKSLAKQYKTRIEMKQIGVRDEARLLADFEHCGREICCKSFMKDFEPVTMKMAKSQKTTLDPSKISGRCGRLKCCLNFEAAVYEELEAQLPKKGAMVVTKKGRGEVLDLDILQQFVTVETDGGQTIKISADEILSVEEDS